MLSQPWIDRGRADQKAGRIKRCRWTRGGVELSPGSSLALGEVEGVVSCGHGWDKGTEGVPGEHICVGGHGIVGEQGGVALMVEGMARLVELREEELVETDDLTNWSAS